MYLIKPLSSHVANQIAAGEVVQRPSSVVKELLENAIDSGADVIELRLKKGGKQEIHIVDNGSGIYAEDIELAFTRHATSKIQKAEDLFKLTTNGFRGEALASIAAISEVELRTNTNSEPSGYLFRIAGNESDKPVECVCKKGSSLRIKNLFFNIPARRNFLKSDQVEYKHCLEEFTRIALLHAEISFKFFHNDQLIFDLQPENRRGRIQHLISKKINAQLIPIQEVTDAVEVDGFIVKPEFAKKTRGQQYFFVNNRFTRSPYLHKAVVDAFEGLLLRESIPGYFIELRVPSDKVDVNIHPTKSEVKFEENHLIFTYLKTAIKHALGQYGVHSSLEFDLDPNLLPSYKTITTDVKETPQIKVNSNFNPFSKASTTEIKANRELYVQEESFSSISFVEDEVQGELAYEKVNFELYTDQHLHWSNKYIVVVDGTGELLVIDQYRAHQRIIYESMLKKITLEKGGSQSLLFPVVIKYDIHDLTRFKEIEGHLIEMGFVFETKSDHEIELQSVPNFYPIAKCEVLFEDLIKALEENDEQNAQLSFADITAKTISKHMAIRGGESLNFEARKKIITDLNQCKEQLLSPFNKKIYIRISQNEISKKMF